MHVVHQLHEQLIHHFGSKFHRDQQLVHHALRKMEFYQRLKLHVHHLPYQLTCHQQQYRLIWHAFLLKYHIQIRSYL